jgi:hypothetical protein
MGLRGPNLSKMKSAEETSSVKFNGLATAVSFGSTVPAFRRHITLNSNVIKGGGHKDSEVIS